MDDEVSIPVTLPLDSDGFLSRECPTCEARFKLFIHQDGDPDAEAVDQYFCPSCGVPAGVDMWWTPDQLEYVRGAAGPELDRLVQEAFGDAFKGIEGVSFEPDPHFTLGVDTPPPPVEPNDMVIVEPPCHPNEPLKVPEGNIEHVRCMICGTSFAA